MKELAKKLFICLPKILSLDIQTGCFISAQIPHLLSLMIVIVVKEKSPFRLSGPQAVSHACGFWRIHRGQSHRGGMVKAQAGAGTLFVSSCGSWEGVKPCPIQRFFPLSVRFRSILGKSHTHTVSRGWWTHPNVLLPRGVTLLHPASCNEFHAPLHTS